MDLVNFRKQILEPLMLPFDEFEGIRVEVAYEDLLNTVNLSNEIETRIKGYDVFELTESGNKRKVKWIAKQQRLVYTLLKASYIFADIFVSVLLGEVLGKPGISLYKFLVEPQKPLLSLSTESILPAYCTVVYRNKIIVHHDIKRVNFYVMATKKEETRLVPYSEFFHVTKADVSNLISLKEAYKSLVPGLAEENNEFNLCSLLFYNIPLGNLGEINKDRKLIDKVAERGGCTSMNADEVIQAIDKFAIAVIEAVT